MPVKESVTEESGFRMKPDSLIRSERRGLPTETARHLGQLHLTAAGDHLHHFARVVELFQQAVYVGHRRAAAFGDAFAAAPPSRSVRWSTNR